MTRTPGTRAPGSGSSFLSRTAVSRRAMEANYAHGFSGGGSNLIGVLIGLSFFTR